MKGAQWMDISRSEQTKRLEAMCGAGRKYHMDPRTAKAGYAESAAEAEYTY